MSRFLCSLHFIEYLQQPLRDCLNDRHGHGIPRHLVQSPVPEVSGGELGKLLVREALQPPVFERGQTADSAADPDAVPVLCGQREHRFANFLYPSPLLSDGCTVGVQDSLNGFCEKYPLRRVCGQRQTPISMPQADLRSGDRDAAIAPAKAKFGAALKEEPPDKLPAVRIVNRRCEIVGFLSIRCVQPDAVPVGLLHIHIQGGGTVQFRHGSEGILM